MHVPISVGLLASLSPSGFGSQLVRSLFQSSLVSRRLAHCWRRAYAWLRPTHRPCMKRCRPGLLWCPRGYRLAVAPAPRSCRAVQGWPRGSEDGLRGFYNSLRRWNARGAALTLRSCHAVASPSALWLKVHPPAGHPVKVSLFRALFNPQLMGSQLARSPFSLRS